MRDLHLDVETFCDLDLKKVGVYRYVAHPSFAVTAVAWKLDERATQSATGWGTSLTRLPPELVQLLGNSDVQGHAFNAAFETAVLNSLGVVVANPLSCTMQRALAYGLPGKLETAAAALGLKHQKDMAGHRLMLRMSRPLKPGQPPWTAADYVQLAGYCERDVEAEAAAAAVIPELLPEERELAELDARMNTNGELGIDEARVGALQAAAQAAERLEAERCAELTGDAVTSPGTQTARLGAWLAGQGLELPDVARATVEDALADLPQLASEVREVLQIRLRAARASTRKLQRMLEMSAPGSRALQGQFQFCGAGRTGRWCVDADTLIETPGGVRKIVDLQIGDIVYGGKGAPCTVLAKVFKGREVMYHLTGPAGEHVVATAAHRILTHNGWTRIDDCFEEPTQGCYVLRRGCTPVSYYAPQHRGDCRDVANYTPYGVTGLAAGNAACRVQTPEDRKLFAKQDGGEQSDAGRALRGGTYPAAGAGSGLERQRLHAREPHHGGEVTGTDGITGALGSAPHRWRQDQRHPGQFRDNDPRRTPEDAQTDAWALVQVGERDVWDITVARDASYLAQGLVHHNSGRGVQVQNLPRVPKGFSPELFAEMARAALAEGAGALDAVAASPVLDCVSWSLRACLKATDDSRVLWSFDFSQIEARVLAWLAGQQDILAVFASGEDVYRWAAAQFGSADRQLGKVLVLALGFGMGAVKLREQAWKSYGVRMTAAAAERFKTVWRQSNSRIMQFWYEMDAAAKQAILDRSRVVAVGGSGVAFVCSARTLQMRLPSGRVLYYHGARLEQGSGSLVYWGTEVGGRFAEQRTWGGKLAENATQACARDIMAEAMMRGWRRKALVPCMSVHDELVYAVSPAASRRYLQELMLEPPPWAGGLPLAGESKTMRRYSVRVDKPTGTIAKAA